MLHEDEGALSQLYGDNGPSGEQTAFIGIYGDVDAVAGKLIDRVPVGAFGPSAERVRNRAGGDNACHNDRGENNVPSRHLPGRTSSELVQTQPIRAADPPDERHRLPSPAAPLLSALSRVPDSRAEGK